MKRIFLPAALAAVAGMFITGCACCTKQRSVGTGDSFQGPLGLQLYSLRGEFKKGDIPGTLALVRSLGFKEVELAGIYNLTIPEFNRQLADKGLRAVSGHFPFDRFRTNVDGVIADAKALGLQYAGCAWIPHKAPFGEADTRAAAEVFNRAGEAMAKHGIKLFYHTHGYEFAPHGTGTLFDLLVTETKPQFVTFEIDVFWVLHPGYDPAKLIAKYPGRFELMHVKDMKKGVKGDLTGKSDVNNDVAVGTGQMDWPAILSAAKKAGLKWYFIEDESDDVVHHLPQSIRFLEAVKF
jgi:sugar phosphate isomerase/epimerase